METGAVIAFKVFDGGGKKAANRFCREFYGYTDRSNRGRYSYKRPGFIDKFMHIKILRGLIIVRTRDVDEIMAFLTSHGAEVFMREVVLLHQDTQKLAEKARGRETITAGELVS